MNTTKQQRRAFVLNAKKQWKKGLISKQEYENIQKQMAELGRQQHEALTKRIQEEQSTLIIADQKRDILDIELSDDEFIPEDLEE